jgi:hypothetical protein
MMRGVSFLPARLTWWPLVLIATVVSSAQARALEEIKHSGEMRFCVAPYGPQVGTVEPPACLGEQCQFHGPVRELAEAFAQSLGKGIKTTYRILEWDKQFHNEAGETIREQAYTPPPPLIHRMGMTNPLSSSGGSIPASGLSSGKPMLLPGATCG